MKERAGAVVDTMFEGLNRKRGYIKHAERAMLAGKMKGAEQDPAFRLTYDVLKTLAQTLMMPDALTTSQGKQ